VVRPTPASHKLYVKVRYMTKSKGIDDRTALNEAASMMKSQKNGEEAVLMVGVLEKSRFLSGRDYFEREGRMFPKEEEQCDPTECPLVVHNNWIIGNAAKVYRMREHLMWLYDRDRYYSSPTRKYLTLDNPTPRYRASGNVTRNELLALRTALIIGHLVNRVVILPIFHCTSVHVQCPLNSIIHVKTFESVCAGLYRESSFLRHPKVPDSVKLGLVQHTLRKPGGKSSAVHVTADELILLFGKHSDLQHVFVELHANQLRSRFIRDLGSAFRGSDYRQLGALEYIISGNRKKVGTRYILV